MSEAGTDLERRLGALPEEPERVPPESARALLEAVERRLAEGPPRPAERDTWWRFLAVSGRPRFLRALGDGARRRWAEAVFVIIEATRFTLGDLFAQRCREVPDRVLFHRADAPHAADWTYERTARHLRTVAAVLLGPAPADPPPSPTGEGRTRVAILADNSLATAAVDLACLFHDIFVTPLSVHTDEETLDWIFDRLRVDTAVTDTEDRALALRRVRDRVGYPRRILLTDSDAADPARGLEALGPASARLGADEVAARLAARPRFGMRDVCTVMFTSGSTGRPKGVAFTQQNLVSKRFARAAALPDVGDDEVLLCYLPLYHTFGRYLELLGAIYWRGTYAFAGNPSTETLLRQLRRVRPTGLISIPLRWKQIHARCEEVSGGGASPERQRAVFDEVTGGRLRWGLSAAGYLEPRIFRFFHRHGVELSSGFGMTEGTGGLTMTPPGDYLDDSVGVPLPGTRIRFGETGELQIAGPYIARYLPEEGEPGSLEVDEPGRDDHWLATGDLFREIERGHLRIVDRIKDIYKNNRGQTVAPRKVEAAFTGVPGIRRTFLVGDGLAYNTLLIVPDREADLLRELPDEEERDFFHRLITQANLDLAPYERVVNFAVLDRDFSAEREELTPKGSYRRKRIEENFRDTIEELYRRRAQELEWDGVKVVIPRWFYRDLGLLEDAIRVEADGLVAEGTGRRLALGRAPDGRLRVGDLEYALDRDVVDLGTFARQPRLWVGNPSLVAFAPCKVGWDTALAGAGEQVRLPDREAGDARPVPAAGAPAALHEIDGLVQRALFGPEPAALRSVDELAEWLRDGGHRVGGLIRRRLEALSNHPVAALRCRAYQVLVLDEPIPDYSRVLPAFVESGRSFLCPSSIRDIASAVEPRRLHAFRSRLHSYRAQLEWPADAARRRVFDDLFRLLADFARYEPEYYSTVREELASWVLHDEDPELAALAKRHFHALADWFEAELRTRFADHLDPEAWEGKIEFEEGLSDAEMARMREALVGTTFLQQSLMLTHEGETLDLDDVGPGGIWVSRIRSHQAYSRYRLSINTRGGKHYDIQAVLHDELAAERVLDTLYWHIALRGYPHGGPVLPPFGCCRLELKAFSFGYVSNLTVWERIREHTSIRERGTRAPTEARWRALLATAMATVVRGWVASGRRIVPGLVGPNNLMVPEPDFRDDALLLNVIGWRRYDGPLSLVRPLVKNFYRQTAAHYPWARHHLRLTWIFDAVREALGPGEAREFLRTLRDAVASDGLPEAGPDFLDLLDADLAELDRRYLPPLAVEGARARFEEWERASPEATPEARLGTVEELLRLYRLDRFGEIARYFLYRHTYFRGSGGPVVDLLDRVIARLHEDPERRAVELVELSDLQERLGAPHDLAAFQRLAFPRFGRREDAEVRTVGDRERRHVVVRTRIVDRRGTAYTVHDPTAPAEVGEVYRMFLRSGYPKTISEGDRFLVVGNDREQVVGGVCYQLSGEGVVHLDGIVVSRALHDRGITTAVLEDFATRMTDAGHRLIKTHFFLPGFYLKRGFEVDRRWGGLVRHLRTPHQSPVSTPATMQPTQGDMRGG